MQSRLPTVSKIGNLRVRQNANVRSAYLVDLAGGDIDAPGAIYISRGALELSNFFFMFSNKSFQVHCLPSSFWTFNCIFLT
jgi:hypothetical protein